MCVFLDTAEPPKSSPRGIPVNFEDSMVLKFFVMFSLQQGISTASFGRLPNSNKEAGCTDQMPTEAQLSCNYGNLHRSVKSL